MKIEVIISLISAVIAFASFISSLIFALKAKKSSNQARLSEEKANNIVIGQLETSIRDSISMTGSRVEDITLRINEVLEGRKKDQLTANEKRKLEVIEQSRRSAIEKLLNSYEDACGKYIDNKIDIDRFKKTYISEIANICNHKIDSYSFFMHPESNSKYEAIWKVYNIFHRHEK